MAPSWRATREQMERERASSARSLPEAPALAATPMPAARQTPTPILTASATPTPTTQLPRSTFMASSGEQAFMASSGVPGLAADMLQVPLPLPTVPAFAAAPSGTAPLPTAGYFTSSGFQGGIPVVQDAPASTLPGAMPSAHAIPLRAAGAGTTGVQTKGRRNDAPVIPEGTLRTPEIATAGCDLTSVPDGFPMGPIQGDVENLKTRVDYHTSDPRTGDGAFGVCRTRQVQKSKNKGDTCYLACYKHKEGCKWRTQWEHTTEGWVLLNYLPHCFPVTDGDGNVLQNVPSVPAENGHCHALLHDEARVRARILCMRLPL